MTNSSLLKSNFSLLESSIVNDKLQVSRAKNNLKKEHLRNNSVWPNKITFENFLNDKNIKFFKKDILFILRDFGAHGETLYEDRFNRFILSNVWEF